MFLQMKRGLLFHNKSEPPQMFRKSRNQNLFGILFGKTFQTHSQRVRSVNSGVDCENEKYHTIHLQSLRQTWSHLDWCFSQHQMLHTKLNKSPWANQPRMATLQKPQKGKTNPFTKVHIKAMVFLSILSKEAKVELAEFGT